MHKWFCIFYFSRERFLLNPEPSIGIQRNISSFHPLESREHLIFSSVFPETNDRSPKPTEPLQMSWLSKRFKNCKLFSLFESDLPNRSVIILASWNLINKMLNYDTRLYFNVIIRLYLLINQAFTILLLNVHA